MKSYQSILDIMETQLAIKFVKDTFERELARYLNIERVSAPLFVRPESGLNDNLNGIERPVAFDIPSAKCDVEIVQSLAKWKRLALKKYGFPPYTGLYTDMNAIRRDEELDCLHSVYVDQWDWEKIITVEGRNLDTLKGTVRAIAAALYYTSQQVTTIYPALDFAFPRDVFFITSEELLLKYPNKTAKEREDEICKEHGLVFIIGIGGALSDGKKHDGRAPDYDDWNLNGDLLVYYPPLGRAIEISSMGIRVDSESLKTQLKEANAEDRASLAFHKALLADQLPLTIGGGIGQSRICMIMLSKVHIGEVQCSVWGDEYIEELKKQGIELL